jgi:hypothetical protein
MWKIARACKQDSRDAADLRFDQLDFLATNDVSSVDVRHFKFSNILSLGSHARTPPCPTTWRQ